MFFKPSKLAVALAITVLFSSFSTVQASSSEVTDGMKNTIDQILLVIKEESGKKARREKLQGIVDKKFDYIEMAKRALATNWNDRTPEERKEFSDAFGRLLKNTYITKIERYTDERVDYVHEDITENGVATVKTLIVKKEDSIPVDYKLLKKQQDWLCYDFVIENISMIRNYRSQFAKIIKDSSYEKLLERMKDKIKKLEEEYEKSDEPQNSGKKAGSFEDI